MPTDLAVKFWKEWVEADSGEREEMLRTRVDALFQNQSEIMRDMITMMLYDFTGDLAAYLTGDLEQYLAASK